MRKALLDVTIIAGLAWPAYASEHMRIVKCDNTRNWKECAIITLKGELLNSDAGEFIERTKEIRMARVDLSGTGGNFTSAINIGERLHLKGYNTYVPANSICFSACSLIWMAGAHRDVGPTSMLMFHTAYSNDDPDHADGTAATLTGMYLRDLGYTFDDVFRIFGHDPHMFHLTLSDQNGQISRYDITEAEFNQIISEEGRSSGVVP